MGRRVGIDLWPELTSSLLNYSRTHCMELLLNLLWVAMTLAAFCLFTQKRQAASQLPKVPYAKALLGLVCVMVLLVALHGWLPLANAARLVSREHAPRDGRSPPSL